MLSKELSDIPSDIKNIIYEYAKPRFNNYHKIPPNIIKQIETDNHNCCNDTCFITIDNFPLNIFTYKSYILKCNTKHVHQNKYEKNIVIYSKHTMYYNNNKTYKTYIEYIDKSQCKYIFEYFYIYIFGDIDTIKAFFIKNAFIIVIIYSYYLYEKYFNNV